MKRKRTVRKTHINAGEAARTLGARLRQAREQKGWSRPTVARAVHIDPTWLYKIETGRHWPSWHLAAHLGDLLGVQRSDIETLFASQNPPLVELREELAGARPLAAPGADDPLVPIIALVDGALADVRRGLVMLRRPGEPQGPGTAPDPVLVRNLAKRCDAVLSSRGGFTYFYQLVQRSDREVLTIRGIGRKSLRAIEELLAPMGLSLSMKLDERTLIAVCQEILRNP